MKGNPNPLAVTEELDTQEQERRREVRIDVRTGASPAAYILRRGEVARVEIVNASYRGVFLRFAGDPPPPSQLMKLRFELPTKTIEVHAVPVRIVVDGSGRAGVGARFFALNGEPRQAWEAYISSFLTSRRVAA